MNIANSPASPLRLRPSEATTRVQSAIRELFALLSRQEVISLAGGFPPAAAIDIDALKSAMARTMSQTMPAALLYGSVQGDAPFFADGAGADSLRLSFASATAEQIGDGVRRLAGVLSGARQRGSGRPPSPAHDMPAVAERQRLRVRTDWVRREAVRHVAQQKNGFTFSNRNALAAIAEVQPCRAVQDDVKAGPGATRRRRLPVAAIRNTGRRERVCFQAPGWPKAASTKESTSAAVEAVTVSLYWSPMA